MTDLTEYRARAQRMEDELDRDTRFLTPGDLRRRWHCSATLVRSIPKALLPWINLGRGLQRELRRYRLADVLAYEERQRDHTAAAG